MLILVKMALRAFLDSCGGPHELLDLRQPLGIFRDVSPVSLQMRGAAHDVIPAFLLPECAAPSAQLVHPVRGHAFPRLADFRQPRLAARGDEDVRMIRHDDEGIEREPPSSMPSRCVSTSTTHRRDSAERNGQSP